LADSAATPGATPTAPPQAPSATAPASNAPSTAPAQSATPATPPASSTQNEENSATYVQGYSDGCASSNLRYARQEHVKPNRDSNLYSNDQAYHDGWDHGYRKCEDKITPGGLSIPGNSVIM
jgi:hypothetical protein